MSTYTMHPMDEHNQALLSSVHPADWENPQPAGRYNLVVIGGGTAGLITASVAASMGARTALIERHLLGGDCLNVGCVPSKGVIRGARGAASLTWLKREGLTTDAAAPLPGVSFSAVMERLRRIRAAISVHDSASRYRDEFGVDVYIGSGQFTGPRSVQVRGDSGETRDLTFSRAVIATGARAAAPPIPGLADVDYLTNETLFSLTEQPESMIVLGAGPIGCEMAQSFAQLGTRVTLLELAPRILPREDEDVAAVIQDSLIRAGVGIHTETSVARVAPASSGRVVVHGGAGQSWEASHLLVAIGRAPNLDGLNPAAAGVSVHSRGVEVNDYLQTTNRAIYAAGDIASPYQFTHIAEAAAAIAVQNALFVRSAKMSRLTVPWSTYTSPEVAHVGLSESEAGKRGVAVDVYRHTMDRVDRAKLDGETEGFVKILTRAGKTEIVGATIVAAHAGEMIGELVLAMQNKLGVDRLASVIHPYPTHAEAVKRAAAGYLRSKLTERTKRILATWFRWRR
jgi:pyruvate/2-oxoglutarate dehydrogenase complex dihydrolipoamide dehydrogenase (E3) component